MPSNRRARNVHSQQRHSESDGNTRKNFQEYAYRACKRFTELPTQHTVLELSTLDQCCVTVQSDSIVDAVVVVVVVVVVAVAVTQQPNKQYLQLDTQYNDPQQNLQGT